MVRMLQAIKNPKTIDLSSISGLYRFSLNLRMVEVAGIEPASANPTLTGYYMLSLRFKLTELPVGRRTYDSASPITFSN